MPDFTSCAQLVAAEVSVEELELVSPRLLRLFANEDMKGMNAAWINFNAALVLPRFERSTKAVGVFKDIIAAAADRENGG